MANPNAHELGDLLAEIDRQDGLHPAGYPATRDGVRLGIACAEDEVEEALKAWRACRCKCAEVECDHAKWGAVRDEAIQAAAVLMRLARSIRG